MADPIGKALKRAMNRELYGPSIKEVAFQQLLDDWNSAHRQDVKSRLAANEKKWAKRKALMAADGLLPSSPEWRRQKSDYRKTRKAEKRWLKVFSK